MIVDPINSIWQWLALYTTNRRHWNITTNLSFISLLYLKFYVSFLSLLNLFIRIGFSLSLAHFLSFFPFGRLAVNSLVKASQWCLSFLTVIRGHMHSEYAWNKEAMNLQLEFVTGPVCLINICAVNQNCLLWHFQTLCY